MKTNIQIWEAGNLVHLRIFWQNCLCAFCNYRKLNWARLYIHQTPWNWTERQVYIANKQQTLDDVIFFSGGGRGCGEMILMWIKNMVFQIKNELPSSSSTYCVVMSPITKQLFRIFEHQPKISAYSFFFFETECASFYRCVIIFLVWHEWNRGAT